VVAGEILDTRTGERVSPEEMAARLDGARLVFVGENHATPAAQAAELGVLEALARRGRTVLVGLEMLPGSVQPALDRWVRGEGSEEDLLRDTHWYRHWGFHFGYYRAIFQFARDRKAPMHAVNVEREVITSVRKHGLDKLAPEDRSKLPPRIDLESPEHKQLFAAYMGGSHNEATPGTLEGMYRAQCTWDGVMGWTAVRALNAQSDPRAVMVVLLGVGHVAYGLGAQRQAALWTPLPMASVASVAAFEEGKAQTVRASFADFIWGAREDGAAPLYPALGAMFTDRPGSAGPAVAHVQPGSPAASAGVQQGDILTGIDGVATADKETALFELAKKAWGAQVSLEVLRANAAGAAGAAGAVSEKKTLTAVLERPGAPVASPATSVTPAR
jgi:uncharacterized iron-regulated protein